MAEAARKKFSVYFSGAAFFAAGFFVGAFFAAGFALAAFFLDFFATFFSFTTIKCED